MFPVARFYPSTDEQSSGAASPSVLAHAMIRLWHDRASTGIVSSGNGIERHVLIRQTADAFRAEVAAILAEPKARLPERVEVSQ